ncbi:tetratricopeptide repeat protein [Methyloceanibacter sp.]|uniref:tetratricopeptide repeat protein n=1 Tax=Methyloceanibacter sp. TaxID=1965321 RepID=UPI003D6D0B11
MKRPNRIRPSPKKGDPIDSPSGVLTRLADDLRIYWPLIAAVTSIIVASLAWVAWGVSPLDSAREIAHQKQQHNFQERLTGLHLELGEDFLNVGQLAAARFEFERAKTLDPYSVPAELGLLKVSTFEPIAKKEYDPEVAQRRLGAVLRQNPNDTHALAFLGEVYSAIDHAEAHRYLDQAIAINSKNARAYALKGDLFESEQKTAMALKMFENAVSLSPWNQVFLSNLAYEHFLLEQYQEAERLYLQLLNLNPRFMESYYMLARTQFRLGDFEAAYTNLQSLSSLLNDQAIMSLPRNQEMWWFYGPDKKEIDLRTDTEKRAYARYLMELGEHLLDREPDTRLADDSTAGDTPFVRLLVIGELEELGESQPDLKNKLSSFRSRLDGGERR